MLDLILAQVVHLEIGVLECQYLIAKVNLLGPVGHAQDLLLKGLHLLLVDVLQHPDLAFLHVDEPDYHQPPRDEEVVEPIVGLIGVR